MSLPIVKIIPNTTVDYPNKLAGTFFLKGCPFTCPYCHNHQIAYNNVEDTPELPEDSIYHFLYERKDFLEAIVLSGGEPLMYDTSNLLSKMAIYGYKRGIHTNGYYPDRLKYLIDNKLVDFVGLDIKAPMYMYGEVTGKDDAYYKVMRSVKILVDSDILYECRTTYHSDLLTEESLCILINDLLGRGVKNYSFQRCVPDAVFDKELAKPSILPLRAIDLASSKFSKFTFK